jgi:membrane protein implicated in regulation of membrane protease activity
MSTLVISTMLSMVTMMIIWEAVQEQERQQQEQEKEGAEVPVEQD